MTAPLFALRMLTGGARAGSSVMQLRAAENTAIGSNAIDAVCYRNPTITVGLTMLPVVIAEIGPSAISPSDRCFRGHNLLHLKPLEVL
ncbi:MAG: hypothetical protein EON59_10140 [Alphaproteobacteria bacterium]|nr:MAG: hypothetical protein EON59_10140 [Alphaproteobacteria bacterium]